MYVGNRGDLYGGNYTSKGDSSQYKLWNDMQKVTSYDREFVNARKRLIIRCRSKQKGVRVSRLEDNRWTEWCEAQRKLYFAVTEEKKSDPNSKELFM